MRRRPLRDVVPGMVLAKTLFNEHGEPLLRVGTPLTTAFINTLQRRGYDVLYIRDADDEATAPEGVIAEQVWQSTHQQLRTIFSAVEHIAMAMAAKSTRLGPDTVRSEPIPAALRSSQFMRGLLDSANLIVTDVLDAPLLVDPGVQRLHDRCGYCDSVEMTVVAAVVGRKLGVPVASLRRLALGCLLRDIGNLFLPQWIQESADRLDSHGQQVLREHTVLGYEFLNRTGLNDFDLLPKHIALQHHERQDGKGYPRGLTGTNEIRPRESMVIQGRMLPIAELAAVADVYGALRADRLYRPAFPPERVIAMLRGMAGSHLNRIVVEALLSVVPVYPFGTPIVVRSGDYRGFRGLVVETFPEALDRPVIRLLDDPERERIAPMKIDLRHEPRVEIASRASLK